MGSSAKKKKDKKKDFQKPKLKVGKARPKNTNATSTDFAAKSIAIKQQSLNETSRDASILFNHNLSLLSSKNDAQRRDALSYLTTSITNDHINVPQPASVVLGKSISLILDGSSSVRGKLLKLVKVLPVNRLGPLDQTLLYIRAGLTHLSSEIRLSALDLLDWLLDVQGETVVSLAGGWIKLLRTFQNLLSWTTTSTSSITTASNGQWSTSKTSSSSLGNNKLLVHQLSTISKLLTSGLERKTFILSDIKNASSCFPLWHVEAHALPSRSNTYGYLDLFGGVRDLESEMHESSEERREAFVESGLHDAFLIGVEAAKKEGGEVGRAASAIAKALRLVDSG